MAVKTTGRCAHASFIKNNRLYVHGGYGAHGSDSKFHVWSTMEEINLGGEDVIGYFLILDFSCRTLKYNSVTKNVERRWHQSFLVDNKFFVHGGWNDGGPIDDMLFLDLGNLDGVNVAGSNIVDTMDWTAVNFTDNIPCGRRWHTLVQKKQSQKYLLFGG